jgi:hypothetical protein
MQDPANVAYIQQDSPEDEGVHSVGREVAATCDISGQEVVH